MPTIRHIAAVLTLLLILCGVGGAAEFVAPEQKIVGAEEAIAKGELVTLTVSPVKDKPDGLTSTSVTWKVYEYVVKNGKPGYDVKKFAVDAEGKVFFGAGIQDKTLLAVATMTHVFVKEGDGNKKVGTATVIIEAMVVVGTGGGSVTPAPVDPDRPIPPDGQVTFPDGKYKLAKFAYDAANSKVAPGEAKIKGAKVLAGVFRAVATQVKAGAIKGYKDILSSTKATNDKEMAAVNATEAWEGFSDELQKELVKLARSGALKTDDDYAIAWAELSRGLEAVR